jgi:hypothetical protein
VVKHAVKKVFSSIQVSVWAHQLRPRTESDSLVRKIGTERGGGGCVLLLAVRPWRKKFNDRKPATQSFSSTVEFCVHRALNGLQSTRLSHCRMIWLLPTPLPLLPSESCFSFSVFLCAAGRAYWRERVGGVGEEPSKRRRESLVLYESFKDTLVELQKYFCTLCKVHISGCCLQS